MTATHAYVLHCDGMLGERRCRRTFHSSLEQAQGARDAARRVGWGHARAEAPGGFSYFYDFCPDCCEAAARSKGNLQ